MITENKCRTETRLWREEGSDPNTPVDTKQDLYSRRRRRERKKTRQKTGRKRQGNIENEKMIRRWVTKGRKRQRRRGRGTGFKDRKQRMRRNAKMMERQISSITGHY